MIVLVMGELVPNNSSCTIEYNSYKTYKKIYIYSIDLCRMKGGDFKCGISALI